MSNNPRDSQFAGFAEKLRQEIHDMACSYREWPGHEVLKQREREIIARRVFDLVNHVLDKLTPYDYETNLTQDLVYLIPDLTELPKEQEA